MRPTNSWNRREFVGAGLLGAANLFASQAKAPLTRPLRVGFIGIGARGTGLLRTVLKFPDVTVPAVCDINESALARAASMVEKAGQKPPEGYGNGIDDWKRLVARDDLDAVINAGPWELHAPMSVETMRAGKYAATEVPAAVTVEQCWDMVNASEQTGMPCMILENVCYFRNSLLILNMIRQGLFGELTHCEGGYQHDVRGAFLSRGGERGPAGEITWRGMHAVRNNGNLYPTHPLGPIAWWLDINRGDRFTHLTSMSSKSRGINKYASDNYGADHPNARRRYALGDVNVTLIRSENGATVTLYHDTSSPRPYDLILRVQGTHGIYMGTLDKFYFDKRSPNKDQWEDPERYYRDYEHPLWRDLSGEARSHGHGGADYIEIHQFLKAVRNRTQTPIDVYDTAVWSSIYPLSVRSVAAGSQPVEVPDFTRGKWKTREPVGIYGA
ncbi:MAG: Gfo/Idh/MocA family oxidoreductase [Bryobacteraceae bacterium]|nr:Gfo/Idh/MocA family oxidoreductase [Bryobacterales bacterium]MEB2362121.1 Gfo/Idh/MocA family oxidoreductase [Bryobacterales bacterium]NUN02618.1 Gfo/Idh/MocA family oxidoreductase [Bryobacteraceae bacterium]